MVGCFISPSLLHLRVPSPPYRLRGWIRRGRFILWQRRCWRRENQAWQVIFDCSKVISHQSALSSLQVFCSKYILFSGTRNAWDNVSSVLATRDQVERTWSKPLTVATRSANAVSSTPWLRLYDRPNLQQMNDLNLRFFTHVYSTRYCFNFSKSWK